MKSLPLFALIAVRLSAQTPAPIAAAVETITAVDVTRHVGVIADDSMKGRDSPSRGLELTAQYVADHFQRFGLKAIGDRRADEFKKLAPESGGGSQAAGKGGGSNDTWFQGYPQGYLRLFDHTRARVIFSAGGKETAASFATATYLAVRTLPMPKLLPGAQSVVLVAGRHTAESLDEVLAKVRDNVVLYVPPSGVDSAVQDAIIGRLYTVRTGVVVLDAQDSASFAGAWRGQTEYSKFVVVNESHGWWAHVWPDAIKDALTAAGIAVAQLRNDTIPVSRYLPELTVRLDARLGDILLAPNVMGMLEGSDPKLKHEYLLFTAHMDQLYPIRGQTDDSIRNGADDNASGTAGLLELAEAFSRPGARPRRSLIFLAVSANKHGLYGSRYFVNHSPVPVRQFVANINLDMIGGRRWKDTVVATGKRGSNLGAVLDRVTARHPELRMTPIDGGSVFDRESDQYCFALHGMPVLYFNSGTSMTQPYDAADIPAQVDAEAAARVLRLVFYMSREAANAEQRPRLTNEGRRQLASNTELCGYYALPKNLD